MEQAISASPGKKRGRKAGDGKKKEETSPKKKKPLDSRFGGRTEEEIMQLFLPDHLRKNLDIVFVSWQWMSMRDYDSGSSFSFKCFMFLRLALTPVFYQLT